MWKDLKKIADPGHLFKLLDPLLRENNPSFSFSLQIFIEPFPIIRSPSSGISEAKQEKEPEEHWSNNIKPSESGSKSAVHAEDKSDKMINSMEATYNCELNPIGVQVNDCSFVS